MKPAPMVFYGCRFLKEAQCTQNTLLLSFSSLQKKNILFYSILFSGTANFQGLWVNFPMWPE